MAKAEQKKISLLRIVLLSILLIVIIYEVATLWLPFDISRMIITGFAAYYYPTCNNNKVCESGETQDNCPWDCKTIITLNQPVVIPGQPINITVYFNDSRYLANRDIKFDLTIDGKIWSIDDCWINGKRLKEIGWTGSSGGGWSCSQGTCIGTYSGHRIEITSINGYGKMKTDCKIPSDATAGSHILQSIPTIY